MNSHYSSRLFAVFILATMGWVYSALAENQTISGTLNVTGDSTVSGNLNVIGVADFNNPITYFGTNGAAEGGPGVVLTYTDATSGTVSTITFGASGTTGIWQWTRNSANGGLQMQLSDASNSNILTIYTSTITPSAGIILNPAGISTFSDRIIITGTNSVTATDTTSVLTVGAANNIYLKSSDAVTGYMPLSPLTFAVGYQTMATGQTAVAMGYQTRATGNYSTAMGYTTTASGHNATAMGFNTIASGSWSSALGFAATASGLVANSEGAWTAATGDYSLAMNKNSLASGNVSSAFGEWTIAQGDHQFVVGRYNVAQGNATSWNLTDDLFIVGNGTSNTVRANAFVIKKNGDAIVYGNASVAKNLEISGNTTTTGSVAIQGNSSVTGHASFNGQVDMAGLTRVSGKLSAEGPIRVEPQGDLSMGEFNVESGLSAGESAVKAYYNTLSAAGVILSTTERHNIEDFLIGLDQIVGLNNVVECWSLRSGQNGGSGTILYGLLGNSNGTIINGPTWTPNGLLLVRDNIQYVSTDITIPTPNVAVFSVFNRGATSGTNTLFSWSLSTTSQFAAWDPNNLYLNVGGATNLGSYNTGVSPWPQMDGNGTRFNAVLAQAYLGSKVRGVFWKSSGKYTAESESNMMGASSFANISCTFRMGYIIDRYYNGTISFMAIFSTNVEGKEDQIYNLYKSTIGQGLNLP